MDMSFQNLHYTKNSSSALKVLDSSFQVEGISSKHNRDTDLQLDCPGSLTPHLPTSKGIKRKYSFVDEFMGPKVVSSLSLGLGCSSSSSDSKGSLATAHTTMSSVKENDEGSSIDAKLDFMLHLGNEKAPSLKRLVTSSVIFPRVLPKIDLELSLSTGPNESNITAALTRSMPLQLNGNMQWREAPNVDEGSTSCCWRSGIVQPLVQTSSILKAPFFSSPVSKKMDLKQTVSDPSLSILSMAKSSVSCSSGMTQNDKSRSRSGNSKTCQIEGCGKGARGASGRCISHGGGRRCQKPGCHKGAEGRTVYCKAHGGGRRCQHLGCTKSAEGRTDFCIAHGGGRRCSHEGCTRAARGKSGLCIRHGGGKRCQKEYCTKSAEGLSGLCISHGGGRRCQSVGCTKGAQGSTMFCKAHGGGTRCTAPGCTKGAEGSTHFCKGHGGGKRCSFEGGGVCAKSVHGGTNFCVAHGGGKRCAVPECTKSARGRTEYCVRHGGGKRCKFEGCGKSAQGRTDFCKAHGGGKRCSWGHLGSEFQSQPGGPCHSFARGKTGLCALHNGLVVDKRVHGGVTLGPITQDPKLSNPCLTREINVETGGKADAVNPQSKFRTSAGTSCSGHEKSEVPSTEILLEDGRGLSSSLVAPEGRVHGGSLLAMLSDTTGITSGSRGVFALPTESNTMPHNWI